ncbi:MAG: replication-associated recombination protein A [Elusimicrobiota bacterium]|nr:replication-associated recombination protein A [Endomicrobiia bacterium]MDW8164908.1 replication-associated recombination protein A [Elusimicrobiota bacterium]
MNLFSIHQKNLPLASKFLPKDFDEFVGQEHLLGKNSVLRNLIEQDKIFSLILFGPPGTGKTALAKLIAKKTKSEVIETNATLVGISELKEMIKNLKYKSSNRIILILDEIHHFNRYQQDILLPEIESGNIILIGLTTENPYYYVNQALISRSFVAEFKKLSEENIKIIIERVLSDEENGLGRYKFEIQPDAIEYIVKYSDGDARKALNVIDIVCSYLIGIKSNNISLDIIKQCIPSVSFKYDKKSDYHYDHISALIKSIRGSDPDAALYWMQKMLMAGEDPRYIIRRLIILASEDIGNADPFALVLATSALEAAEFVGMPEMEIILAQVVCYLSCAEKSNACYEALNRVKEEINKGLIEEVPQHLKDGHRDEKFLGHGKGYLYPHDFEDGFVVQKYMNTRKFFYFPKDIGKEKEIKQRLERWREMIKQKKNSF